jgi:transcription termination factor NusB
LKTILRKCKNYELNVQKNKIDVDYIKQLKNCIERYQKLSKIPNQENLHTKDPSLFKKISRSIEKQVAELYDLIRKHKNHVIPMEVLGPLVAL